MRIKEFRIVNHGADHESYFPGHGVSFTRFAHCVTGCGESPWQAFRDALEQMACGFDIPEKEELDTIEHCEDAGMLSDECDLTNEDWYYYVSIDWSEA